MIRIDRKTKGVVGKRTFLSLNGDGDMRLGELITDRTEVQMLGHGEIMTRSLISQNLNLVLREHGAVTLAGVVDLQRVAVQGHADYRGRELNSRQVEVRVQDYGNTDLQVQEQMSVKVDESATLHYEGRPQLIRTDESVGTRRVLVFESYREAA